MLDLSEENYIRWCAAKVAKGFIEDYPSEAVGRSFEELVNEALADEGWVMELRHRYRFEAASDDTGAIN